MCNNLNSCEKSALQFWPFDWYRFIIWRHLKKRVKTKKEQIITNGLFYDALIAHSTGQSIMRCCFNIAAYISKLIGIGSNTNTIVWHVYRWVCDACLIRSVANARSLLHGQYFMCEFIGYAFRRVYVMLCYVTHYIYMAGIIIAMMPKCDYNRCLCSGRAILWLFL